MLEILSRRELIGRGLLGAGILTSPDLASPKGAVLKGVEGVPYTIEGVFASLGVIMGEILALLACSSIHIDAESDRSSLNFKRVTAYIPTALVLGVVGGYCGVLFTDTLRRVRWEVNNVLLRIPRPPRGS